MKADSSPDIRPELMWKKYKKIPVKYIQYVAADGTFFPVLQRSWLSLCMNSEY